MARSDETSPYPAVEQDYDMSTEDAVRMNRSGSKEMAKVVALGALGILVLALVVGSFVATHHPHWGTK